MTATSIHHTREAALRARRRILAIALVAAVLATVVAVGAGTSIVQTAVPAAVAVICAVSVVATSILIGYEQDMGQDDDE